MIVLVTAALEGELARVIRELDARPAGTLAGRPYHVRETGQASIFVSAVGVGVVSAACSLAGLVERLAVSRVIMVGSAGCYANSGLKIGDLAVASSEVLSELGLCIGPGIGSADDLALAGLSQEIAMDADLASALAHAAAQVTATRTGRFLSVVGVSSDEDQARQREERFHPLVENMEGFAAALVGKKLGIPVGEVRGISNIAGNRDKTQWNMPLADERAQEALLVYLRRFL